MTKHRHGAPAAVSPAILSDRGAEALRLGRFKEAMEVFKRLARQDPQPQWTHRLADAYAGRARALADKGMFQEAAIVLENTRATDGTVREPVLYLMCLIRQGQYQKAARAVLPYIGTDPGGADTARLVDLAAALWLAVPAAPSVDKTPGGAAWSELSQAAAAALGAWVEAKPSAEVDALLARIPLRSPFGALRLILKSLTTTEDASGKARGLLALIPATSMFAAAGAAAEAALAADSAALLDRWSDLSPAQQTFVAETRGLPPAAAGLLGHILDAERRGPAALFALLVKPGLTLPEADLRTGCLDLLPQVPACLSQFERRFAPLSELERHRVLALAAETKNNWREAQLRWEGVVETLSRQSTPEPLLARAVVLRHLAELAECHPEVDGDLGSDTVAGYLERSLAADPDHLPATLSLIERYRHADSPKDWHRATEQAAQRFPQNTAILLHAVEAAVARNSYKKAAGFARRLLTLDPINQPARHRMIELQLAHARKQMRAGRADLAGRTLSQAAEWERPDAPSAPLRIAQALATYQAQDAAAEARLRDGVQRAGGGIVGWFRAVLEAALMGWTDQQRQFMHRELAAAQAIEPSREAILSLIETLGQTEIRDARRVLAAVVWRIDPWLLRGQALVWSAAEFQTIAACLHRLDAFDALRAYAQSAMQRDPEDQTARFYRIVAQVSGDSDRLTDAQAGELFALMDQAGSRQDFHMVNRVQRFLDGADTAGAGRSRTANGPAADDVRDEDVAALLGEVVSDLAGMPEKEVRKLVGEFGRNRTIDMLADIVADTPLGEVLSDQQVAQLCAVMIARATERQPHLARR
jgi:tetratricopeptide (TPR) repeat protein